LKNKKEYSMATTSNEYFVIEQSPFLEGEIGLLGAKNSVLRCDPWI